MARFVAEFAPNTHYLDTVGGLPFFECYDPRHPVTRSEDREHKGALMRVATEAGLVLGAEGQPRDWNLPIAAFYEEHPVRMGIDVPLYHLVYHECAVLYWQHGMPYNYGLDNYGHVRGTWLTKFLRGLLYGDPRAGSSPTTRIAHGATPSRRSTTSLPPITGASRTTNW
jgi:hypothetical protein